MLSSFERLLLIRQVAIFEELRDDFLVKLASVMDEVEFPARKMILHEGEEGRSLYVVVSGRVQVLIRDREVAQLDKGTFFGEMSLFDAQPRSASVKTLEPCTFLILNQLQLQDAIEETPEIAVNIIRALSRRVRELNGTVNALNGELKSYQAQLSATDSRY